MGIGITSSLAAVFEVVEQASIVLAVLALSALYRSALHSGLS